MAHHLLHTFQDAGLAPERRDEKGQARIREPVPLHTLKYVYVKERHETY
jgi:hypothetical protein